MKRMLMPFCAAPFTSVDNPSPIARTWSSVTSVSAPQASAFPAGALLLQQGVSREAAGAALATVEAPPGRMQRVRAPGPSVYVDYAHTPSAVEVALNALRPHCRGDLWCVFGCGGERDAGKRPQMAALAERLADRVVVTSDNPRHEDPLTIIDDIAGGLVRPKAATIIEDRAAAIAWTVDQAKTDDTVLIAGKGHEDFQLVGDARLAFSDYRVAEAALAATSGGGAK